MKVGAHKGVLNKLWILLLVLAPFFAEAQTAQKDLMREASIIFAGTVTGMKSNSVAEVPASEETLVARVDRILRKPAAVALATGDSVTLYARDVATFQEGDHATFYTRGVIFGEGLVVREVGHERLNGRMSIAGLDEEQAKMTRREEELRDEALRAKIAAADVIVVGEVEEVRLPQTMALRAQDKPLRISEHNPQWQEAVIKVRSAVKGAQEGEKIVVRFSASEDVAWFRAPKLQIGQTGTFILPKDTVSGAPRALLSGTEVEAYTALKAENLLPVTEAERIRELMQE
jgi:hypothetical protein